MIINSIEWKNEGLSGMAGYPAANVIVYTGCIVISNANYIATGITIITDKSIPVFLHINEEHVVERPGIIQVLRMVPFY
jgi:hypothetical protein